MNRKQRKAARKESKLIKRVQRLFGIIKKEAEIYNYGIVEVQVALRDDLDSIMEKSAERMREHTRKAARGECAWICSDCCMQFDEGMPDECAHKNQRCTDIIKRDKAEAMAEGNEKF